MQEICLRTDHQTIFRYISFQFFPADQGDIRFAKSGFRFIVNSNSDNVKSPFCLQMQIQTRK